MSLLTKVFPQLKHFHLDDIDIDRDTMSISATAKKASARCPVCGRRSRSVHSWYARTVSDLPVAHTVVVLCLRVKRQVLWQRTTTRMAGFSGGVAPLCLCASHLCCAIDTEALRPQRGMGQRPMAGVARIRVNTIHPRIDSREMSLLRQFCLTKDVTRH